MTQTSSGSTSARARGHGAFSASTPPGARVSALDLARGVAILGMFFAHAAPVGPESSLALKAMAAAAQVTAPLFVMLAGVSLGLMTGGGNPAGGARWSLRWQILRRGLVLVVLGLALWQVNSGIAVVIDYIGIVIVLLVPLLFAPRWVLGVLATAALIASPLLKGWAEREGLMVWAADDPVLVRLVSWFVLGPHYWAALFLFFALAGLIIARSDVRGTRTPLRLVLTGGVLGVVGLGAALATGSWPHPGSAEPAGNLVALGCAVGLVGALLLLERHAAGRGVLRVLAPLEWAGRMPLTIYTLQIVLFGLVRAATGSISSWLLLLGATGLSLLFAWAWTRWISGQGPLEAAVAWASGRPVRLTQ
ncbi:heparan-alpha-glucosaminide N-acetyltransferase domain-containing protein [Zhihengliuella sp.]|uniref:heparan-alpha-glucosaminide N-acetyltransferase domain-containing protein n=1 Tax=Zhihengliuella sp. TaxID=1954483 RepID=UPI0028114504|nr:heparan-alpha-glucosaminide N-acetyltransferase domain-containing protein [Zhihengliuella sp.]